MSATILLLGIGAGSIGFGVVSGFFLTFSDFVLRSLDRSSRGVGIEVMQVINREVWRSTVMGLMWGMLALALVLSGVTWLQVGGGPATWVTVGTAQYVVGVLFVSFSVNLPLNDQLEVLAPSDSAAAAFWRDTYLPRWTRWNMVRAIASASAAACWVAACVQLAR